MKRNEATYAPGERLVVAIERIVPGGDGLARTPKGVVLVEHSAPGDTLEIEIESQRGGAPRGQIRRIIESGLGRIDPPCPWYGRCGGCDFQHLSYAAQLDAKEAIVRDAFARIGQIEWPHSIERVSAPQPWESRARIELHVDQHSGVVGFFARRSNEIVPIGHCLVSRPEINSALQLIRSSSDPRPSAIHLQAGDGNVHAFPHVADLGSGPVPVTIGEIVYLADPAGFFQSSFELLPRLIDTVVSSAGSERHLVWDLFSGAGLFALPLARQFEEVVAVEVDRRATGNAARSARESSIGNVRFVTRNVDDWVTARQQEASHPDLVIVDPPRSGLGRPLSEHLASKQLRRLTYVSCDPATLGRDLRSLTARNLRIVEVTIFDLFPQTHHVETVVQLVDKTMGGSFED